MIKTSSRQAGSVQVILTIILVATILSALGFVFWNNFMNNKTETISAASKTTSQTTTSSKVTPVVNTINIRELGISIVVPDSIKDLTYTYTADGTPTRVGGSNVVVGSVNFSTASLTTRYPECASDKANPLGGLTKITGTYADGVLGPTWSGGGMAKQFSDSFLTFAGPQSACYFNAAGNDTALGASITSHISDLSTAVKDAKGL